MPSHPTQFVSWVRSVAPYFHAFRGKTFVLAFGGEIFAERRFVDLNNKDTSGFEIYHFIAKG